MTPLISARVNIVCRNNQLIALFDSHNHLEIALKKGSAAQKLQVKRGD